MLKSTTPLPFSSLCLSQQKCTHIKKKPQNLTLRRTNWTVATCTRHRKTLFNTTSTPALLLIEVNSPEITNYQPFPLKKPTYWKISAHLKPVLSKAAPFTLSVLAVFSKSLFLFLGTKFNLPAFCHSGRQDGTLRPQLICTEMTQPVLSHKKWGGLGGLHQINNKSQEHDDAIITHWTITHLFLIHLNYLIFPQ